MQNIRSQLLLNTAGLLCAAAITLFIAPAALGQDDGSVESVWDGVYTVEQAQAGADLFSRHCIACHATEPGAVAGHAPSPPLVGEPFRFRWTDSAIADLFDTLRQTMPQAAPNSLSADEYAALTAYLLQLNEYPAGATAIDPRQYTRLLDIYIDPAP
jgi:mono/diheme cytochrome c family protein